MTPKTLCTRMAAAGLFALFLALAIVPSAGAEPVKGVKRRGGFDLLGAASTYVFRVNRVQCGMNNQGDICTDTFGSPTGGGGFWPNGSANQYIFNSGLQVAGIIPDTAGIWAGDTVGAYFFDARGTQPQGQQVTTIYSSLVPEDAADWPNGAVIRDTAIFNSALIGRDAISQEDVWVRYWDGPGLLSGRKHPMGILVEHRGLAWNYPEGNQDIIYWVFTFYNISASDPAKYSGLDPAIQGEIAGIAADWVAETEDRIGVDIPTGGYTIDSVYAAFSMDPDVGNAGVNAATAILPFNMGLAYKTDFNEPTWYFPPEINGPPFGPYPGFVGVKYLKSPADQAGNPIGLSLFSNFVNGNPFPDPVGVSQLWRYLSGAITPSLGDPPCDINPPRPNRLCALVQNPVDIRFFQSSGPFKLVPGQSASIVVAYVHAAPIASAVAPYFAGTLNPGIPPSGAQIASGTALRPIEIGAGWVSHNDADASGAIEEDEVTTVPRSLLRKAGVAQSLYEAKFLLPFAPEAPTFYLVPGDNQVTVVWEPSATETVGDPYYGIASDNTSPLYDPNYRSDDVEGYRIYRGRTRAQLEMVAQFDYAGRAFTDYVGNWAYEGACAPELGITTDCPTFPVDHDLVGAIPQVKPGGRVELADGSVLVLESFNSVEDAGFPALTNGGVPFSYVDNSVVNSVTYYYAVTAFDVNSVVSGPGSLESTLATRTVVPRAPAAGLTRAVAEAGLYGRGTLLNPEQLFLLDPDSGTFNQAPPPTGAFSAAMTLFAEAALTPTVVSMRVDSVLPAYYEGTYYMTLDVDGQTTQMTYSTLAIASGDETPYDPLPVSLPADPTKAEQIGQTGLPFAGQGQINFAVHAITWYSGDAVWHDAVDGSFWSPSEGIDPDGGSRWFSGDNETMGNPTLPGGTGRGRLDGVTAIYTPLPYVNAVGGGSIFRRVRQATWHAARQADVKFYWGAAGALDSVIDVTHNVPVPFNASTNMQAGWGFRTDISTNSQSAAAAPDGIVTYYDFPKGPCVDGGVPNWNVAGCETRPFAQTATLSPVDVTGDGAADGNGFALYFDHEFYIFQTDALPAAGTVWTHRSYFGDMSRSSAGRWSYTSKPSNAAVPGLEVVIRVESSATLLAATDSSLESVHPVPDPYYATSGLEITPSLKVIKFVNLPPQAIVRIYSLSGVLVDVVELNDPGLGGEASWDVRNRNSQFVASGVYFYVVEAPSGAKKIGRFTVVNSGGLAIGQGNQ